MTNDFITEEWLLANGWVERDDGCGYGHYNLQFVEKRWFCYYDDGALAIYSSKSCTLTVLAYGGIHTIEDLMFLVEAAKRTIERGEEVVCKT